MEDEASGGSDRLPSNSTGECECAGVDPVSDDSANNTLAARPQPHNAQVLPLHFRLPAMADRDRRNRVERACSNIPAAQSRSQHRRHDEQAGSSEARNRHRDRNNPASGRRRAAASSTQRPAAESEPTEDDSDDARYVEADEVMAPVTNEITLLPILQADFVQELQSCVSSAHNWQVCCQTYT